VPVLAADAAAPPAGAVATVLAAAAATGPAVVDLPRGADAARSEVSSRCRLIVVVGTGSVRGLAAARAVAAALAGCPCGLVLRRGAVRDVDAADLVGVPLLGVLPPLGVPRDEPLSPTRLPPRLVRVAAGVLDGLRP
jgi:hypothetical protein